MTRKTTHERIEEWLEGPYDQDTKQEILSQLEKNPAELQDAFFKDLSFGTGGLRAKMGIGTNRLNQYTIGMATQGLANYLNQLFPSDGSVFIGYDVRRHSKEFAFQAARVLAANQIRVFLAKEICPTPLVSFACRHFHCKAAIMITASHNPPEYNGYKVYWSDGGQIIAPHDRGIIEEVRKICDISQVHVAEPDSTLIEFVESSLDDAYLEKLSTYKLYPNPAPIHVIYTPLHGTGIRIIPKALTNWNFSCSLVEKQSYPDGLFTHAESPNPEEAAALKLGAEMLVEKQADLLLGTDPDADRVGTAVLHEGKPVFLTGHQIGCLCLDHICLALTERQDLPPNSLCIKTIVTTELFKKIAESYQVSCIDVLTGFKYIAAEIAKTENTPYHYLFGAEESYGYLFNSFVRDKDAISSSCLIAEVTAKAKQDKLSLVGKLYQLYRRYGVHRELLTNIGLSDNEQGLIQVQLIMNTLRENPPSKIHELPVVQIDDYLFSKSTHLPTNTTSLIDLPKSDVLRFWLNDQTKLVIRPSGTEPKIKIYAEVCHEPSDNIEQIIESCDQRLQSLTQAFLHLIKESYNTH